MTTDEATAAEIKRRTEALNEVVDAARKAGLIVELELQMVQMAGLANVIPHLWTRVLRPIYPEGS